MNSSIWGYLFLILGLLGLFLVNMFGEITINDEQNYYLLKEVTQAAMLEAVDENAKLYGIKDDGNTRIDSESMHCAFNVPGTIRIIKERFVELFMIKFAQNVNINADYEIIFNDIDECPPKVTITVITKRNYSNIQKLLGAKEEQKMEDIDITNVMSGILETPPSE